MIHDGRDGGGGEAQEEPPHGRKMKVAPGGGETLVDVVAAIAPTAQVARVARIGQGGLDRGPLDRPAAARAPEGPGAQRHRDHRPAEGQPAEGHHHPIGDHRVKRPGSGMIAVEHRLVLQRHCQDHDRAQAERRHHRDPEPVPLEDPAKASWPSMIRIAFGAQFGEGAGQVHAPLMRRRVLAGVIASFAVVAEVREVGQVAVGEGSAQLHRREDRAVALAIAAGIADLHGAAGLGERGRDGACALRGWHPLPNPPPSVGRGWRGFPDGEVSSRHGAPPPVPPGGRKPSRWSCRSRPSSPGPTHCRP